MAKTKLPLDCAGFSIDRLKTFNLDITWENHDEPTMQQRSVWFDLGFFSVMLYIRWE